MSSSYFGSYLDFSLAYVSFTSCCLLIIDRLICIQQTNRRKVFQIVYQFINHKPTYTRMYTIQKSKKSILIYLSIGV